jgi:uroporphyrinogen-III decarboxylase
MNSYGLLTAAIEGRSPLHIPVVLPYFHLYLEHKVHELTGLTWAHRIYGTPGERAEFFRLARAYFELDWISVGGMISALQNINKMLGVVDGSSVIIDKKTGETTPVSPQKPPEQPIGTRIISNSDEIGNLPEILSPEAIVASGVLDHVRLLAREFGTDFFGVGNVNMPCTQNYFYLGIYDMMIALKLEPELVHALVGYSLKMIKNLLRAMKQVGVSCVWLEDCYVAGDLISRKDYEIFFHDPNMEIIEEAKRIGLYTVYYLTGDVMSRIPHILEMQPDCLGFEESKKTFVVDVVKVRKAVGNNMCLLGNVDSFQEIERGDEKVWERSVLHQMQAASPYGKFILSSGSPITPDTPKEKVRHFVRFARDFMERKTLS